MEIAIRGYGTNSIDILNKLAQCPKTCTKKKLTHEGKIISLHTIIIKSKIKIEPKGDKILL